MRDLWKDYRQLEILEMDGQKVIKRNVDQETSIDKELEVLELVQKQTPFKTPQLISHGPDHLILEYIAGTRAFNLFTDLKYLFNQTDDPLYHDLATRLITILEQDLNAFQSLFYQQGYGKSHTQRYPAMTKLSHLFQILLSTLNIGISFSHVSADLKHITDLYEKGCDTPFRDATPKNVLLLIPELFQGGIRSFNDRIRLIEQMVKRGKLASRLNDAYIYHIDFSGCPFLVPRIDDWIALNHHESTNWLFPGEKPDFKAYDNLSLCAAFVRFSRFGGRKLAYRILNRDGHRVRFSRDNERFYFDRLVWILNELTYRQLIKGKSLLEAIERLKEFCGTVPDIDYMHSQYHVKMDHTYYSDVFPN